MRQRQQEQQRARTEQRLGNAEAELDPQLDGAAAANTAPSSEPRSTSNGCSDSQTASAPSRRHSRESSQPRALRARRARARALGQRREPIESIRQRAPSGTAIASGGKRRGRQPMSWVNTMPRISFFYGIAIWMYWDEGAHASALPRLLREDSASIDFAASRSPLLAPTRPRPRGRMTLLHQDELTANFGNEHANTNPLSRSTRSPNMNPMEQLVDITASRSSAPTSSG